MPVTINGSAGVTTNTGAVYNSIQSATAVASTSGTNIDFTGIPSWVKRITVIFSSVSTSGVSNIQVQLGDSGGVEATGYTGSYGVTYSTGGAIVNNLTTGFGIWHTGATQTVNGHIVVTLISGTTWVCSGTQQNTGQPYLSSTGGTKTLSDVLDRIRITSGNGTDTFDAGTVNILFE
jgi:hypothetical protein